MNIVDSSGWLEYFGKGANGKRFAPIIQETANLIAPTITIYEVFKRILQQRGEDIALSAIGWMTALYSQYEMHIKKAGTGRCTGIYRRVIRQSKWETLV